MTKEIVDTFGALDLKVTPKVCEQLIHMVETYENARENPLTLNSRMLAVHRMYFFPQDRTALFHIFGVEEKDIQHLIKGISSINKSHNVESDAFNVFCVWVLHLIKVQHLPAKLQTEAMLAVAKYFYYKLFTALTLRQFKYTVKEDTMMSTIMSLSKKFDIISDRSWKDTATKQMREFISPNSIHYKTFINPEEKFLYVISDVYTRISAKIILIAEAFYKEHKQGNRLSSISAVNYSNVDGEKFLVHKESTVSSAQFRIINDMRNPIAWTDYRSLNAVASRFPQISPVLLRNTLQRQSTDAVIQTKTPNLRETGLVKGREIIFSHRKIASLIVEASTRHCIRRDVLFRDKKQAWDTCLHLFSSSRTLDPDVIRIKDSVAYFIDEMNTVQRPATKSSLRVAMIMYVVWRMLLSF